MGPIWGLLTFPFSISCHPLMLGSKKVIRLHFCQDGRDKTEQLLVLSVVSLCKEINAPLTHKLVACFQIPCLMHSDALAPIVLHQLHAGHISETVTNIDHIGKRNRPAALWSKGIQFLVLIHIQHPFVDPKQELGLGSIVDMIPYKDTRIQLFDVLCSDGDRGPNGYGAIVLGMEPSISFV